jgi:hypothetical protein
MESGPYVVTLFDWILKVDEANLVNFLINQTPSFGS